MTLLNPPADGGDDRGAPTACVGRGELARFLGVSVRSLDRAAALDLLPEPDFTLGRSPRWSPATITAWLRTRPRLPGRNGTAPMILMGGTDLVLIFVALVALAVSYAACRTGGKGARRG